MTVECKTVILGEFFEIMLKLYLIPTEITTVSGLYKGEPEVRRENIEDGGGFRLA